MQAAATVVQRNIVSVYPALNGVLDKSVGILNTTFQPRGKVNGALFTYCGAACLSRKLIKPGPQTILFRYLLTQHQFVLIRILFYGILYKINFITRYYSLVFFSYIE